MALIGKILNDYRYANRMGLRELAKQLGISAATLCRIESGKPMGQATIVKLFNMLFAEERPIEFIRSRKEQGRAEPEGELKPCPFCGGTDIGHDNSDTHPYEWLMCEDCGAKMHGRIGTGKVFEKWNRRGE